jgi:hypothetical protein
MGFHTRTVLKGRGFSHAVCALTLKSRVPWIACDPGNAKINLSFFFHIAAASDKMEPP